MLKGFVSGEEKDIKRITMGTRNLFDKSTITTGHYANTSGTVANNSYYCSVFIPITAATYYFQNAVGSSYQNTVVVYDTNKQGLRYERLTGSAKVSGAITFQSGDAYIRINCYYQTDVDTVMLNLGSTPLPYEPYGYQEGWEVRDSQDRLIWGREDELQTATGTLPFKGYGLSVKVKSLLGNAVQNGTPAPDNIVTPEMCGVRTGNLFDDDSALMYAAVISKNEIADEHVMFPFSTGGNRRCIFIPVNPNTTYTWSCVSSDRLVIAEYNEAYTKQQLDTYTVSNSLLSDRVIHFNVSGGESNCTFTTSGTAKMIGIYYQLNSVAKNMMLNTGSTALPYEPYGWKVPFENHGENLFDASLLQNNMHLDNTTGLPISYTGRIASPDPVDVSQYSTVTISYEAATTVNAIYSIFSNNELVGRFTAVSSGTVIDVSNADKMYICFYSTWGGNIDTSSVSNLMLNLGSTPKPYSPYLNATLPVYLGEVPTVRRVRKLVLTGEENWTYDSINTRFSSLLRGMDYKGARATTFICSHYEVIDDGRIITNVPNNTAYAGGSTANPLCYIKTNEYSNEVDFKAYLASEYAAGHPVTIWYVLATPETGIVNEPLCKISTYADELTTIQVHGLSAPLYGIGDYKDTLNLSTGVVTRKVKKLVLTGQEEYMQYTGGTGVGIRITVDDMRIPSSVAQRTDGYCTHFVPTTAPSGATDDNITFGTSSNVIYMLLSVASQQAFNITTYDEFKAWIAAQYQNGTPVVIWYILSTSTTETVTVPTGMTGEIEGYLTQVSTPSPTNRSVPKWNGVEETGGTYAVTVYTPPEIPTTTGENTLIVDSNLAPSKLEVSIHAKKIHYGFKIDKSNDDSESAVIYTHDAVTMTPAHMDFTNDRFDYGSWGNAFFVRDCYPVALNLDGTIAYRLDPDDYTKKTDGTPSDIFYELLTAAPSDWSTQWKQYYTKDANDNYELNSQGSAPTFAQDTYYKLTYNSSFTGNFMMAFPKVWFYRHEDSQYNYIEISNYKLSDDWKCYAHINASGQEVDFIYLPLFKGVIVNSKLRSLPGQIPQGNTTATDEVNAATALGSRWQIWDHSSVECLNDLLTLMSKSIDSQGRYGAGRSSAYNASDTVTYGKLQSGTLIKKGKFHGYSSGYKDVKVFGIESLWANRYDRIQGLLLANGVWKVKMTPPYNFTGTDFVTLSSASVPTDAGYLSRVQTSEYGSIPAATISTSGKYFKDFFYRYSNDTCVPLRGGNCGDTDIAGYRFIYAGDPASRTVWSFGASPVYK